MTPIIKHHASSITKKRNKLATSEIFTHCHQWEQNVLQSAQGSPPANISSLPPSQKPKLLNMSTATKSLIDYLQGECRTAMAQLDASVARLNTNIIDGQLKLQLLQLQNRLQEAESLKVKLVEDTLRRDLFKMKRDSDAKALERLLSESKKELESHRRSEGGNNNSNVEETSRCVVCLTNPKDSLVYPCSHANLCKRCADVLYSNSMNCPTCRSGITTVLRIYDNL